MEEKLRELLENNKYTQIKSLLKDKKVYDIADVLNELEIKDLIVVYRLLPKDLASEVFAYLDTDMQVRLIQSLSDNEAVFILNELDADDATDLVDEMPAIVVNKLLSKIDKEQRTIINQLLKYPDNSAGSVMSVEYLDFKAEMTVKQALIKIREDADEKELFRNCYVLDKERKLTGIVDLKDILVNKEDVLMKDIMRTNFLTVNTLTDQEIVADMFSNYDLTSMPVVDSESRLVGIITIDDVMDIVESETTEDIEKMAAIVPTEKPYLKLTTFEIWKSRIPWLLLLMISATFTGKIIQHFEDALKAYVILTSFIPMLMDTGGNAGSQASITIIRGISLNDIEFSDIFKVMWKEFRVSILIAICLAAANFVKLMVIDGVTSTIAGVVCLTLVVTIMIAKFIGCTLPLLAKKVGFDPAVMASPFITTIVDALSLFVYFSVATLLLGI